MTSTPYYQGLGAVERVLLRVFNTHKPTQPAATATETKIEEPESDEEEADFLEQDDEDADLQAIHDILEAHNYTISWQEAKEIHSKSDS